MYEGLSLKDKLAAIGIGVFVAVCWTGFGVGLRLLGV